MAGSGSGGKNIDAGATGIGAAAEAAVHGEGDGGARTLHNDEGAQGNGHARGGKGDVTGELFDAGIAGDKRDLIGVGAGGDAGGGAGDRPADGAVVVLGDGNRGGAGRGGGGGDGGVGRDRAGGGGVDHGHIGGRGERLGACDADDAGEAESAGAVGGVIDVGAGEIGRSDTTADDRPKVGGVVVDQATPATSGVRDDDGGGRVITDENGGAGDDAGIGVGVDDSAAATGDNATAAARDCGQGDRLATGERDRAVGIDGDGLATGQGDGAIRVDDNAADAGDVDGVAAGLGLDGNENERQEAAEGEAETTETGHVEKIGVSR